MSPRPYYGSPSPSSRAARRSLTCSAHEASEMAGNGTGSAAGRGVIVAALARDEVF